MWVAYIDYLQLCGFYLVDSEAVISDVGKIFYLVWDTFLHLLSYIKRCCTNQLELIFWKICHQFKIFIHVRNSIVIGLSMEFEALTNLDQPIEQNLSHFGIYMLLIFERSRLMNSSFVIFEMNSLISQLFIGSFSF